MGPPKLSYFGPRQKMAEHKNCLQPIYAESPMSFWMHTPTSITDFLQEVAPGTAAKLSGAFASKAIPFVPVRGCHDHRAGHSSR